MAVDWPAVVQDRLTSIKLSPLTSACGWRRWRVCRPSSWWRSCHSGGLGSHRSSSETRRAASPWRSCPLTDRSPGCLRSEIGKKWTGQQRGMKVTVEHVRWRNEETLVISGNQKMSFGGNYFSPRLSLYCEFITIISLWIIKIVIDSHWSVPVYLFPHKYWWFFL